MMNREDSKMECLMRLGSKDMNGVACKPLVSDLSANTFQSRELASFRNREIHTGMLLSLTSIWVRNQLTVK